MAQEFKVSLHYTAKGLQKDAVLKKKKKKGRAVTIANTLFAPMPNSVLAYETLSNQKLNVTGEVKPK